MSALVHMRYLVDVAFKDAQWATLAGPIAAALPPGLLPAGLAGESRGGPRPAPRPHRDGGVGLWLNLAAPAIREILHGLRRPAPLVACTCCLPMRRSRMNAW
jgi:hypothetical protein